LVKNFSNVVIRNVDIVHEGGPGIKCFNAPDLTIQNVSVMHTGTSRPLPSSSEINIACEFSDRLTVTNARLYGGSSGIYVLESSSVHLSFIEGYDFRGPFPRGQLVQFNKSPFCTLEDFSAINENLASWTEDNVSIFQSDNCIVRRGLLDGNNSPSGVGVMFEDAINGLVEDVDTIGQGNGSFSAYPSHDITFRRSRAKDNICEDQGRGAPLSNALVWAAKPGSTGLRIEDSSYFNLCNPNNKVWDSSTFDVIEITSVDFQTRSPIVNKFPWETEGGLFPPTANFTYTTSDLKAIFTGTSSDSDGSIVSRKWNFGDGNASTLQNPSNIYASSGTFKVSLTVTDNDGATHSSSKNVTVDISKTLAPAAPSNLTATVQSIGRGKKQTKTVRLDWVDNSDNEDSFVLEICQKSGRGKSKGCTFVPYGDPVLDNITTFEDSGIVGNFRFRVKAQNANGDSAYSNEVNI
jgi:PKD repeat protein